MQAIQPDVEPVALTTTRPASTLPAADARGAPGTGDPADRRDQVAIRIAGQHLLTLTKGSVLLEAGTTPCRLIAEPAASQPDGSMRTVIALLAGTSPKPVCTLEITELESRTRISLLPRGTAAQVELIAETRTAMLPACLQPRESDRILNAAAGPASGEWFDGLFMPERDLAIHLEGRVWFQELPDRVRLVIASPEGPRGQADLLTLYRERDFLKTRHQLKGYAPLSRRGMQLMPAAWMPLDTGRPPSAEEIARNAVWMAINLHPYGAAGAMNPAGQPVFPMIRATPANPRPTATQPHNVPAVPTALTGPQLWDAFQQTAASIVRGYWGHGLIAQSTSSSVFVGEGLSMPQARLFAAMLGLAGQSPIACEPVHALPDERIDLLRRIIPAAPIRAIDLFEHQGLPSIWNLSVNVDGACWNVLGLLNTSEEPRTESVELADLHLGSGVEKFAVYDLWENRLMRVVRDRFQLQVPATGCRVVAVVRVADDQPTLLGSSRHITGGVPDLHGPRWDTRAMALTGTSDLVAGEPYELRLYLPEGDNSVELDRVESPAALTHIRAHGPLRMVTFEGTEAGPMSWRLVFRRVSQPPQSPPPPPRNLAARQNTRGVLLSWFQPDERVVTHRIYRNQNLLAEVDGCEYQDSTVVYNSHYHYTIVAVDFTGGESTLSDMLEHQTPLPASTNLTQLVPLMVSQERFAMGRDRSVAGGPLRLGNQRIYRGIGAAAPSRIAYFLGGGYETFSGVVGIDDAAGPRGSAVFRLIADGQTLFTSPVMRRGQPPLAFSARVEGKLRLELVVTDAEDGNESDFCVWGNPYLKAASPIQGEAPLPEAEGAGPLPASRGAD
jgi:hypothetical protein